MNRAVARKVPIQHAGVKSVAKILWSRDGGPVKRTVNGRRTIYTGFFISVKADFAQMPWESRHGEKAALNLAEASGRVVSLLAQPHRVEISIKEQKAPLRYFPDLLLKVHPSFLEDLLTGVPFSTAALKPSLDEPDASLKTVIIEIKDDRDRRQHSAKYRRKLDLARQVYKMKGITFLTILRARDILAGDLRTASGVVSWRHTSVTQLDVWAAEKVLRKSGMVARAGEVADAIAPGAKGWAKLRALHVRRYVDIDLTKQVSSDTQVRWLLNNSMKVAVRS